MKCPACNSDMTDHSEACAHCGAPAYLAVATENTTLEHCTYCGTREESNLSRCSNCGLKRGFKVREVPIGNCSNCGGSWRDAWLYCRTCGIMRKQGLIEVLAPLSVSFQALKNYPVTTVSAPVLERQDYFTRPTVTRVLPKQEEEFRETSFSSDEFAVNADDPVFSAPTMSENEVVERMFANDGNEEDDYTQTVENVAAPVAVEPSIVVYDLQQERTHEVVTENTTVSDALQKNLTAETPPQITSVDSVVVAPALSAAPILQPAPVVAEVKPAAVPSENKPVQAVRVSSKVRGGTPPPIDKFLVKLIALLVLGILLFAGLIVSGFKIRDLFSKSPITAAKPSASTTAPVQTSQLSEPSHTPPEVEGMVYVAGGQFMMGEDDDPNTEIASPAHQVTVQPFFMDRTEVTNAAYAAFVKATKYTAPAHWKGGKFSSEIANYPVVNVSWDDANAYAKWAGKRLPTESEWEFAARSKDGRLYPWGKKWLENASNTKEANRNQPAAVGSYEVGVTALGIQDMAGNVWEWTLSDVTSYRDPNLVISSGKVIRGGAFSTPNDRAKTTYRGYNQPESKTDALGFRCVKDIN